MQAYFKTRALEVGVGACMKSSGNESEKHCPLSGIRAVTSVRLESDLDERKEVTFNFAVCHCLYASPGC